MNDHLRQAMNNARLQPIDVAAHLAVDPKTVARWLKGRTPATAGPSPTSSTSTKPTCGPT
jgi:hypothetical protein